MKYWKFWILVPALMILTGIDFFPDGRWPFSREALAAPAGPDKAGTALEHSSDSPSKRSYRTIMDMAGRRVKIPEVISKVLATSPPPTTFVYMLAPEKLGGWFASFSGETRKYIPAQYLDIPVLSWGRKSSNYEAYIAMRPDLVFVGYEKGTDPSMADLTQNKFGGIPVVCVENTKNATGYAETIRFMGDVLGVPERAQELTAYYQNVLDEVQAKIKDIPQEKKIRVYYAEGNTGLATDPGGSPHSQLIEVCGGINVADCRLSSGSGMTAVTMESVLMWNPQVIITTNREFIHHVDADISWKKLAAVQNRRIYLVPGVPFNWFDRPPGVNRIIGIPWTACVLYPDLFTKDWLKTAVKKFFTLYYHYPLSDEEFLSLTGN